MKKGFTLIELLAVIIILAIIALIATPIILGIINDARKESNERSVELYASAVRNAIVAYQLTHPTSPSKFADLDIQYDGEVECAKEELYADGSFYIAECTVNGTKVDYTYGTKQQAYKPQYYSFVFSGNIGGDLPSDAKTTVSELNPAFPFYLGLDVDSNNKVTTAYTCYKKNEIEYCLKGNDTNAYETNKTVLVEIFGESACSFDDTISNCYIEGLFSKAYSNGSVSINSNDVYAYCFVGDDGNLGCIK